MFKKMKLVELPPERRMRVATLLKGKQELNKPDNFTELGKKIKLVVITAIVCFGLFMGFIYWQTEHYKPEYPDGYLKKVMDERNKEVKKK